jgi:phosphatidylserine decarboxylase
MANTPTKRRLGGWLPTNEKLIESFHAALTTRLKSAPASNPEVEKLRRLIKNDPILRMDFTMAIEQAQEEKHELGYSDIDGLMDAINRVMTMSPSFDHSELVGCPINALLDWLMCVPAGYAVFRDPALNAQFKRVLQSWNVFLNSAASCTYLNTNAPKGWFCPDALSTIHMDEFQYDQSKQYWGFKSWNDFFIRKFKPGVRPVADPHNSKVITSGCESTPYAIEQHVKLTDTFWIKSQPYSLLDIFTAPKKSLAENFVDGTVYQAFLSAYNYHRWHAPVSGTIADVYQVEGTYYSEAEAAGEDPGGPNDSQGYITAVAARMIMVIDCDDKALKKVACVFVGMAEVSSCTAEVKIGQHVNKGDELGYFQFGGSTCCLIFQPNVINHFTVKVPTDFDTTVPVKLNSTIAIAN